MNRRKTPMLKYEPNFNEEIKNPDDRYYLNVRIPYSPDSTGFSPARFQQQFTQPIIDVPDDYYLSIVRFSIPTQNIPILIPEIQPFPNTNINNTVYSVTLRYSGNDYQEFVQFVTETPNAPQPNPITASNPNPNVTPYYYIYTYTNFLNMVNRALENAFTSIAAPPGGAVAPYFQYNTSTEKIELVAQEEFYNLDDPNAIEIYMNYQCFTFFDGLASVFYGVNQTNGKDVQIIVRNDGNNYYYVGGMPNSPLGAPPGFENVQPGYPPGIPFDGPQAAAYPYLVMAQQYPALVDWLVFKNLTLVCNLLPIRLEYSVGNSQAFGNGLNPINNPNLGNVNNIGILKDFEPILDTQAPRTTVQYALNGPYQLINMVGEVPISNLDITIYWTDQFGRQYLVDIPFNQVATIKLAFIKKSTFTG
jgi:hypothetical protein